MFRSLAYLYIVADCWQQQDRVLSRRRAVILLLCICRSLQLSGAALGANIGMSVKYVRTRSNKLAEILGERRNPDSDKLGRDLKMS